MSYGVIKVTDTNIAEWSSSMDLGFLVVITVGEPTFTPLNYQPMVSPPGFKQYMAIWGLWEEIRCVQTIVAFQEQV